MIRALVAATTVVAVGLGGGVAATGAGLAVSRSGAAFVKPVDGAWVSQGFGCTSFSFEPVDRACAGGHFHSGIDLACARGTPVHATLPGIASVYVSATGYGLHVIIDHGGGLSSLYGHLDTILVADGASVEAGEVIGTVGSSGNATGPHLHFEIRRDGIPEDPRQDLVLP